MHPDVQIDILRKNVIQRITRRQIEDGVKELIDTARDQALRRGANPKLVDQFIWTERWRAYEEAVSRFLGRLVEPQELKKLLTEHGFDQILTSIPRYYFSVAAPVRGECGAPES